MSIFNGSKPANRPALKRGAASARGTLLMFSAAAALGTLGAGQSAHGDQARSSSVTTWSASCEGSTREWWDDMCMAWRKEMGTKGWSTWWRNFENVIVDRYTDPSISAWGFDNSSASGFDGGQAALLCTHGGRADTGWWGLMQRVSQGECGANVDQWKPGLASGGKSRYLHLSSCNSMRWDKVNTWFAPAKGGVHLVTGFHGLMYIGSGYVDEYEDQASDGYSGEAIAESWVDNMYHDPIIGHTVCPVAMAFGSSKNNALNRLFNERYKSPSAEQAGNHGVLEWISGCNPDDAGALPE